MTASEPRIATWLHAKGKALGLPIAGNFELTPRCNFQCPMCYVHMTPEQIRATGRRELTAGEILDIARQARDLGMVFALLTGGEPLIREDFFEIYDGMKALGLLISINTNGSVLTGSVMQRFLADPPARFNISLYGGSDETYRSQCGQPVYHRVVEAIRTLRGGGADVSLNLSITPHNRDDLEKILADARDLGVNVKAAGYMYPPARLDREPCRLSAREAARAELEWDRLRFDPAAFYNRCENILSSTGIQPENCPTEQGEGVGCRAGSTAFWLTWDGKLRPCGMMTGPETDPIAQGFAQAWAGLRTETEKIRLPAACGTCGNRKICGVCAAVCQSETGSFDGVPEYVCEKTRHQLTLIRQVLEEGISE